MNNYIIQKGDNLSNLALKNNTTVSNILSANPNITNPDKIYAGGVLNLPKVNNTIQTTDAIRQFDTQNQNAYNSVMNSKGFVNNPSNIATQNNINNTEGQVKNNVATITPIDSANTKAINAKIDEIYATGIDDPNNILSKLNGYGIDINSINTRVAELNKDNVAYGSSQLRKELLKYDTQLSEFQSKLDTLKTTMDLQNQQAIDNIKATFESRRTELKGSYDNIINSRNKMGYMTDGFRYTPSQTEGIITNDEQNYIKRLSELNNEEQSALLQASTAHSKQDWEMLSQSMDIYNKTNEERKSVLSTLLKTTTDTNNTIAGQQKKLNLAQDILTSSAPYLQQEYNKLTTTEEKDAYITKIAETQGVSTDLVRGILLSQSTKDAKNDWSLKNAVATYNKKVAPKVTSTKTSTASKGNSDAVQMAEMLDSRTGSDGYVAPEDYLTAKRAWVNKGGKGTDFDTRFKVYVNPKSYVKVGFYKGE